MLLYYFSDALALYSYLIKTYFPITSTFFKKGDTMVEDIIIKVFQDQGIRAKWNSEIGEYYYSIIDVIEILTESKNPQQYWRTLKNRLKEEGNETVTNCNALKMPAKDGKMRLTDVANSKELLRLIQSIPPPKSNR